MERIIMSDQTGSGGFFSRIGSFFKGGGGKATMLEVHEPQHDEHAAGEGENGEAGSNGSGTLLHATEATRSTFLRPWAKRDAAIVQLQEGFSALTGLMGAVKDSLE